MGKNIFSLKREAEQILSQVERSNVSIETIEESARRLAEMGDAALSFVTKHLEKSKNPAAISRITHLIEILNDHSYSAILEDLLTSGSCRDAPAKVRIELLATLKSYDAATISDPFTSLFKNPGAAYISWIKRVMEDFEVREYRAISLLEEFLIDSEKKVHLLKMVAATLKEEAVPLLAILADCDSRRISAAALTELGRIRDDRSVAAIKDIIRHSWQKDAVDDAQKALRRLSFSGYDTSRAKALPAAVKFGDYKVFLGPIDAMGHINLTLAASSGKGRMELFCLVINDEMGLVDAYGSKELRRDDLPKMLGEISEDELFVEGEIDHFIRLLNGALYKSEKNGIPLPPEFHYRKSLLKGRLKPERYRPSFDSSLLKEIKEDISLIEKGGDLLDRDEFKGWIISTSRVFDYAEKLQNIKSGHDRLSTLKERRLVKDLCREVLLPMRPLIAKRLFMVADFLRMGKSDGEVTSIVLSTALNLADRSAVPWTDLPFITKLAIKSIQHCEEALNDGFDLREYEEELDEMDE